MIFIVIFTVVLTLAGCGGGNAPVSSGVRSPASTSSATSLTSVTDGDVLAAYRGMWKAFVDAATIPDPDAPAVRKYASDDALKLIVSSLVSDRDHGKVAKGNVTINPSVVSLRPPGQPTEAALTDCVDDTNWLNYKKSGALWDSQPGGKHHTTATVKYIDGAWKVSSFTLETTGSC